MNEEKTANSYEFKFRIIHESGYDGAEDSYTYTIDDENGKKVHDILSAALGHEGKVGGLMYEYFGSSPDLDEVSEFFQKNCIKVFLEIEEWI